jgi:hypothetical protein
MAVNKTPAKIYVVVGIDTMPDGQQYTKAVAAYDTLDLAEKRLPNFRYCLSGRYIEFRIDEVELNTKWGSEILASYYSESEDEN